MVGNNQMILKIFQPMALGRSQMHHSKSKMSLP